MKEHSSGYLTVSKVHKIFYRELGNLNGLPVFRLHGGPGSKSKLEHADDFNLEKIRLILMDQRGTGASIPYGELCENTTSDLVEDIEKLRLHLNLNKIYLYGPSWGSTLALRYAQKYPQNVEKMVVRGVFLGNKENDKWINIFGANQLFPEFYERFINLVPLENRSKLFYYLYDVATGNNYKLQKELLLAFSEWEDSISSMSLPVSDEVNEVDIKEVLNSSKIYLHYIVNNYFLKPNEILSNTNISKIRNIPIVIINGRYDLITPVINAWKLHKALPKSKLEIINLTGHNPNDEGSISIIRKYLKFDW